MGGAPAKPVDMTKRLNDISYNMRMTGKKYEAEARQMEAKNERDERLIVAEAAKGDNDMVRFRCQEAMRVKKQAANYKKAGIRLGVVASRM